MAEFHARKIIGKINVVLDDLKYSLIALDTDNDPDVESTHIAADNMLLAAIMKIADIVTGFPGVSKEIKELWDGILPQVIVPSRKDKKC